MFNSQLRATNFAKDRDLVGELNIGVAFATGGNEASFIKAGGRYPRQDKSRNRNESRSPTSSRLI